MNKLHVSGLAAVFASTSTLALLLGSAQQAPVSQQSLFAYAPVFAMADKHEGHENSGNARGNRNVGNGENDNDENGNDENDNNQGNGNSGQAHNCVNPAGHTRGWCKHGNGNANGGGTSRISGTVLSVNGSQAQVRLDDGRIITVNENGSSLNVGQHYALNGCYQGSVFQLNCNGNGNGGNYQGGTYQQRSGTIIGVGTGTVTLLGVPPVTINVQQAINAGRTNGSLSVGRHITAYGYDVNGTFYATSIG